jgi:hypothetical protein
LCLVVKLLGPTKTHSKDPLSLVRCMIFMAWISSCSIASFYDGYQHLGLIPFLDHIVWFCVGVNGGPAKGVGCIQEFIAAYTYLCE